MREPTEQEVKLLSDALYENLMEGRIADLKGISFEEAEELLKQSIREHVRLP